MWGKNRDGEASEAVDIAAHGRCADGGQGTRCSGIRSSRASASGCTPAGRSTTVVQTRARGKAKRLTGRAPRGDHAGGGTAARGADHRTDQGGQGPGNSGCPGGLSGYLRAVGSPEERRSQVSEGKSCSGRCPEGCFGGVRRAGFGPVTGAKPAHAVFETRRLARGSAPSTLRSPALMRGRVAGGGVRLRRADAGAENLGAIGGRSAPLPACHVQRGVGWHRISPRFRESRNHSPPSQCARCPGIAGSRSR